MGRQRKPHARDASPTCVPNASRAAGLPQVSIKSADYAQPPRALVPPTPRARRRVEGSAHFFDLGSKLLRASDESGPLQQSRLCINRSCHPTYCKRRWLIFREQLAGPSSMMRRPPGWLATCMGSICTCSNSLRDTAGPFLFVVVKFSLSPSHDDGPKWPQPIRIDAQSEGFCHPRATAFGLRLVSLHTFACF
jgi:hypothetical protein